MEKVFLVKESSLQHFADKFFITGVETPENNMLRPNTDRNGKMSGYAIISIYKEIIVTKSIIKTIGKQMIVRFELPDTTQNSNKQLINSYVFTLEEYDDYSFKLVLAEAKTAFKNNSVNQ